jgi:hypothetical protein
MEMPPVARIVASNGLSNHRPSNFNVWMFLKGQRKDRPFKSRSQWYVANNTECPSGHRESGNIFHVTPVYVVEKSAANSRG